MKVLGIERNVVIDFKDRKTGRDVHTEGLRLHLGIENKNVEGIAVEKPMFISKDRPFFLVANNLKVGDDVRAYYNRFGSVESIEALKQ